MERKESIEKGIEELEICLENQEKKKQSMRKVKVLSEASAPLAQRLYEEQAKQDQADKADDSKHKC